MKVAQIVYAKTVEQAEAFLKEGYEPVECSFGNVSVVGPLVLDHHGIYSSEPAVSVKAVSLAKQGIIVEKFVTTGFVDTDAAYTIGVLFGAIPPDEEEAQAIAELDTNPRLYDQTEQRYRRSLIYRRATIHLPLSLEGFVSGVEQAIRVFNGRYEPEEDGAAVAAEFNRREEARKAIRLISGDHQVLLASFGDWGEDIWFQISPLVIRFDSLKESITLYCDVKSRFNPFGPEGLKKIYQLLGPGWGGRENIGGSPRDRKMTGQDACDVFRVIDELQFSV